MNTSIANLRRDYTKNGLLENTCADNPLDQFAIWFSEALSAKVLEPNAMNLSTVSANGKPHGRVVLLKAADERGFVFYTNYTSDKGKEIAENSHVALTFWWPELERQVRIEGCAEKVARDESQEYFHSRPFASQVGAWASHQSSVITNREFLEETYENLLQKFSKEVENGNKVPLPEFWGGYVVIPERIEFWQGRTGRLHDRIAYVREHNSWTRNRLSP